MPPLLRIERLTGRERAFGIVGLALLAAGLFTLDHLLYRAFAVLAAVSAAGLCVRIETKIDFASREVIREYRLLGRPILPFRRYPFDHFARVRCRREQSDHPDAPIFAEWVVALVPQHGQPLIVRQNPVTRAGETEARELAADLARRTGLPLEHPDDAGGASPA